MSWGVFRQYSGRYRARLQRLRRRAPTAPAATTINLGGTGNVYTHVEKAVSPNATLALGGNDATLYTYVEKTVTIITGYIVQLGVDTYTYLAKTITPSGVQSSWLTRPLTWSLTRALTKNIAKITDDG